MQPQIPEPRHRVGPKGVSSGVSLRRFPDSSLQAILDICHHYEAKCSGKYISLASRYVFQMSKEIRSQIDELLQHDTKNNIDDINEVGKCAQFRSTHTLKDDANSATNSLGQAGKDNRNTAYFLRPLAECLAYDAQETTSVGPGNLIETDKLHEEFSPIQQVRDRVLKQQETIDELVLALNAAQQELSKMWNSGLMETSESAESFRKTIETERASHQEILSEVKRQFEEKVAIAQMESINAKERAEQEMQAVQQRTDEVMELLVNMLQEEKENAKNETEEIQKTVTRDYFLRRGQLDDKIKNIEENERRAVKRACMRLKRLHTLEVLASKRDHVVREIKGISDEEISMDKLHLRNNCCNNTNYDEAGCNMRCKVKEEECVWLRSRVNDLEDWVKALTTALRESNKITYSNCTASLFPDSKKSSSTVRKKIKPNPSKPVDESRYTYTKNVGACGSGSMFSYVAAHPPRSLQ